MEELGFSNQPNTHQLKPNIGTNPTPQPPQKKSPKQAK